MEVECCKTIHLHEELVRQIENGMPKEEITHALEDFFSVWRCDEN